MASFYIRQLLSPSCRASACASEVRRQKVPQSRSHYAESSVAEVGMRSTDEKRAGFGRGQSSEVGVDDKAAVISQVARRVTAQ